MVQTGGSRPAFGFIQTTHHECDTNTGAFCSVVPGSHGELGGRHNEPLRDLRSKATPKHLQLPTSHHDTFSHLVKVDAGSVQSPHVELMISWGEIEPCERPLFIDRVRLNELSHSSQLRECDATILSPENLCPLHAQHGVVHILWLCAHTSTVQKRASLRCCEFGDRIG